MNAIINHGAFTLPPAVYAEKAHESRSESYRHVKTSAIVDLIRGQGYEVQSASAANVRLAHKQGFQKHLVRFRRISESESPQMIGDSIPQLILINSHDGTSGITIAAGLFRLVCLNGLVVADSTFSKISIPHRGSLSLDSKVLASASRAIEYADNGAKAALQWSKIELSYIEQLEFAKRALELRYPNDSAPIRIGDLLTPRRYADSGNDLWRVFNRVQENLVKGGLSASVEGRKRGVSALRNAQRDFSINSDLWGIAHSIYEAA